MKTGILKAILKPSAASLYQIALAVSAFLIYLIYFPDALLHPNTTLAGITGDALKNYYTYAFHAVRDTEALSFSGMQFPYGEHVVYTDCQPLLSGLLRLLPFTHPYTIGILHYLLFLSYVISPVILFRIFQKFKIAHLPSFLFALGLTLLSPQFQKINGGHHGLAYGFMIPLCILLCLNVTEQSTLRRYWYLVSYVFLCFFLHPYMGFSLSLLSGLYLLIHFLLTRPKSFRSFILACLTLLLPVSAFKIFMSLTDHHSERTTEPFGGKTILENTDSLLAPDFGPFQTVLEKLFPNKIAHLEGHTYLGVSIILLFLLSLFILFRRGRKIRVDLRTASFLLSALVLLGLSFGWHTQLLDAFNMKSQSLNQFRAASRFAWSFYYAFPLFLIGFIQKNWSFEKLSRERFLSFAALSVFLLNFIEADAYLRKDGDQFWKYRNVLNADLLKEEEKKALALIKKNKCQAIVAFPVFHVGSETYARQGADASMIPAFLYSFHSGLPILGAAMSRTSIQETVGALDLLNSYHNTHPAQSFLSGQPFVILRTTDELLADELRLLRDFHPVIKTDLATIGFMSQGEFLSPKFGSRIYDLNQDSLTNSVFFLAEAARKPFQAASVTDYQLICTLDSLLPPGEYLVSYQLNTRGLKAGEGPGLIVASRDQAGYRWEQQSNGRTVGGFYKDFQIFEYKIHLDAHKIYEFILQGEHPGTYTIKNFLVHPDTLDIRYREGAISYWNNYPLNLP